jgi:hypothetical protein
MITTGERAVRLLHTVECEQIGLRGPHVRAGLARSVGTASRRSPCPPRASA